MGVECYYRIVEQASACPESAAANLALDEWALGESLYCDPLLSQPASMWGRIASCWPIFNRPSALCGPSQEGRLKIGPQDAILPYKYRFWESPRPVVVL